MFGFSFGKQESEPEAVPVWDPKQQGLFNALAKKLKSGLNREVTRYPGQMYAPENQYESGYLDYAQSGSAERLANIRRMGETAYDTSPEQVQGLVDARRAAAMRDWEQYTAPGIRESFAGPGYYGTVSREAEIQGIIDRDVKLRLGEEELRYNEILQSRQAHENAKMRKAQFAPGAYAQEAGILGTAGQYARNIENEEIMAGVQRWLGGETVDGVSAGQYNPYIQMVFQALGLTPQAIGQNSSGFNVGVNASSSSPATPPAAPAKT